MKYGPGAAKLSPNSKGSMKGLWNGILREAAHVYMFAANSSDGLAYRTYVESLSPPVYRCQCYGFIIHGKCKHGKPALEFESLIKREYPAEYRAEKKRQRSAVAKGVKVGEY